MLKFHRLFSFGTMAAALCWGGLGLSVYYLSDPFQQTLIILVALSVSGGSVIVTAALIHPHARFRLCYIHTANLRVVQHGRNLLRARFISHWAVRIT